MVRSLRLPLLKTFAAVVAIAVAACTLVVAAQERFRTDVAIVTLNVAVRQNGTPVRDLKATDLNVSSHCLPHLCSAISLFCIKPVALL